MNSEKRKKFDAVQLMRTIRDQLARETEGLSVSDELRWWRAFEVHDPILSRLVSRAAQQAAPADGRKRR